MHQKVYILLGSNMGDSLQNLKTARDKINLFTGTITASSAIYLTAAWGNTNQSDFLNQVIELETSLPPHDLLKALLQIETEMGRKREQKWEPRIIDLDILFYDNLILDSPGLQIPHPAIQDRRFVLEPLWEIQPGWVHPVSGKTCLTLLKECSDTSRVKKL